MNKVKHILNNPILVLSLISIFGLYWLFFQFDYSNPNSIAGDGVGYYQYLPNTFINNNLDSQTPDKRFFNEVNQKGVNKYYAGTAVSMSPSFFLGHGLAYIFDIEQNGYSWIYHWAISFSGLLFLLAGVLFLIKFLKLLELDGIIISVTILLLLFGTNLFSYTFLMPSMSHVYSFCWVTGFLFFIKSFSVTQKNKHLYLAAFFLGMIILVRPINGIIAFALPFLFSSKTYFFEFIKKTINGRKLLISLIILFSILFLQSIFWYLQCGQWWVWSYGNEGFEFTNPYWNEFLFGFRKGTLIYTPMLWLSIAGLRILIRKEKFRGISLLLFFVVLVYLLSSWWNWYYGPSFGQRPLVEFYGLSAFLIAYLFQHLINKKSQIIVGSLAIIFVFLNLFQTYQYQKNILSSWDMNWNKYQYSFLKAGDQYRNVLGGNNDIMLYKARVDTVFSKTIEPIKISEGLEIGRVFVQGNSSIINYKESEFNFALTISVNDNFISERGIYILTELDIMDFEISHKNEALFVVDISDSTGNNYHYYTFPIRNTPPRIKEIWKKERYSIEVPEVQNSTDRIKLYIWNKEQENFWIKDLKIDIITID